MEHNSSENIDVYWDEKVYTEPHRMVASAEIEKLNAKREAESQNQAGHVFGAPGGLKNLHFDNFTTGKKYPVLEELQVKLLDQLPNGKISTISQLAYKVVDDNLETQVVGAEWFDYDVPGGEQEYYFEGAGENLFASSLKKKMDEIDKKMMNRGKNGN